VQYWICLARQKSSSTASSSSSNGEQMSASKGDVMMLALGYTNQPWDAAQSQGFKQPMLSE
jgi:hypothetical protein